MSCDHGVVLAAARGGDAHVADLPLALELVEMREQHIHAVEAVDLHQVEHVGAQSPLRFLDHRHALREVAVVGGDLGGDEGLLAIADIGEQLADDLFGLPVRRRGIDHRSARGREAGEHLAARSAFFRRGRDCSCWCPRR